MAHAIRVDSRFATANDTARILGVSKSRTEALIKIARRYTDRILKSRASKTGHSLDSGNGQAKSKSAATVGNTRTSRARHAGTKITATKSKKSKARR
jgi:type IV secretory pathway TrbL component